MRVLTSLLVVAALCPLSACYVGNTPPTSRRADAGTAVEDASTPKPEPEDAGTPTPEPKPEDLCASDEECGDDARCVRPEGARAYCMLIPPPPADAGTPDAGPSRCDRDLLCSNAQCGRASAPGCEPVDCGSCGAGYTCQEGLGRCEYTGPLWALRVVSARIERCDTSWDSCRNVAPPFCSPTLPDPFVRVNGVVTTPRGQSLRGDLQPGGRRVRGAPPRRRHRRRARRRRLPDRQRPVGGRGLSRAAPSHPRGARRGHQDRRLHRRHRDLPLRAPSLNAHASADVTNPWRTPCIEVRHGVRSVSAPTLKGGKGDAGVAFTTGEGPPTGSSPRAAVDRVGLCAGALATPRAGAVRRRRLRRRGLARRRPATRHRRRAAVW